MCGGAGAQKQRRPGCGDSNPGQPLKCPALCSEHVSRIDSRPLSFPKLGDLPSRSQDVTVGSFFFGENQAAPLCQSKLRTVSGVKLLFRRVDSQRHRQMDWKRGFHVSEVFSWHYFTFCPKNTQQTQAFCTPAADLECSQTWLS